MTKSVEGSTSSDEAMRLEALLELVQEGSEDARGELRRITAEDESPRVRYAARKLLDLVEARARREEGREGETEEEMPPRAASVERLADAELRDLLKDEDPDGRLRALSSISGTQNKTLLGEVLEGLDREADAVVLSASLQCLGRIGTPSLVPRLAPFLRDENSRVRANVVEALMNLDPSLALPLILPLLQDPDHRVQANVSRLLAREGIDEAMTTLERMLGSERVWMRDSAVHALAGLRDPRVVALLARAVADRNPSVRAKAQRGLEAFAERGDEEARRFLDGLAHEEALPEDLEACHRVIEDSRPTLAELEAPNPRLRMNIVNEIIACKDVERLPVLVDHLRDEENVFVTSRIIAAVGLLGEAGVDGYRDVLASYLGHGDDRTVANTIEALERLDDRSLYDEVRPLVQSRSPRVRGNALVYLRRDSELRIGEVLRRLIGEEDPAMRRVAIFAGERIAREMPEVLRELIEGLGEERGPVYYELCQALQRLTEEGLSESRILLDGLREGAREISASYRSRLSALGADGLLAVGAALLLSSVFLRTFPTWSREDSVSLFVFLFLLGRDWPLPGWGKRMQGLELLQGRNVFRRGPLILLRQLVLLVPFWNFVEATMPLVDPEGKRMVDLLLGTRVLEASKRGDLRTVSLAFMGAFVGLYVLIWPVARLLGGPAWP